MQTFRKIVSKISNESIFHHVIEQKTARQQHFSQAVQQFSHLTSQKKQQTLAQIFGTFKRQRSTRANISALLLIDFLHSLQPEITLFHNCREPKVSKEHSIGKRTLLQSEKIFTAEEQFVKFYFSFLKLNGKKVGREICFFNCSLEDWIEFCEISIEQILQIIKIDFVLSFLTKNTNHQTLIKMALESIFQKVSFDLKVLNKFLEKYLRLIRQKHDQSFRINAIYEKTFFINSNLPKFNAVVKQLSKKIDFERYEVDKELNKSIQIDLYERQEEKKVYLSSRKKIEQNFEDKNTNDDKENLQKFTIEGDTMLRLNDFI